MKIIAIALKDLMQIMRDWKGGFFLVVMPVAFTLLFGFAFGGSGGTQTDERLPVGFIDQDKSSLSAHLLEMLDGSQVVRLVEQQPGDDLEKLVAEADLAAALVIPAGYAEELSAGGLPRPVLIVDESTNAGVTAQSEVMTAVGRLSSAIQAARISTQVYAGQRGFANAAAEQAYFDEAARRTTAAWSQPPIRLLSTQADLPQTAAAGDQGYGPTAYAHASPGMIAQFSIAGLMAAAEIIVVERKTRSLQRLLTTATSRAQILAGHFLAIFCMGMIQYTLLILFGQLFLGLDYFRLPAATMLMVAAIACFSGGLGLLIGVLAKSEEQVIIYTLVPMFVLAALGGAWVTLEVMSETMQTIGHFTPVAWIMDGMKGLLFRGWGLHEILTPVAVLLAYAAGCLGLAIWKFRSE